MSRELYVTDLDGTLLGKRGALSPNTADTLCALLEGGVRLTYATSRSAEKSQELLAGVPFALPAIVLNGAMLVDPRTGEALEMVPLEHAVVDCVLAACARRGLRPFVLGRERQRDVLLWSAPANVAQARFIDRRRGEPRMREVASPRPAETTLAIALLDREPVLHRLGAELPDACAPKLSEEIYDPGWHLLEVHASGAHKATMLERLCARLGVALGDVTVFGDQPSDLGMMRLAGTAVAVANAHPSVIAVADVVIGSNDDDAVPRYLEARDRE